MAVALHVAEQHIRLDRFRDKICRMHSLGHDIFTAFVSKTEIVFRIQNAHDIIGRVLTDRVERMPRVVDRSSPSIHGLVEPKQIHIGSMRSDLLSREIVELKDILDKLFFFMIDTALLTACIHHESNICFAELFIFFLGIDPAQTQDGVCGDGEQPNDGGKQL